MAGKKATIIRLNDKALLFFSTFDPLSRRIIQEVHKDPTIKPLFEYIQLNDERGKLDQRLPSAIKAQVQSNPRGIPILVIPGFGDGSFLLGIDVVNWLENNIFHGHGGARFADLKSGGLPQMTKISDDGHIIADESIVDHDEEFLLQGTKPEEVVDGNDLLGGIDAWTQSKQAVYRDAEDKRTFGSKIRRAYEDIKQNRFSHADVATSSSSSSFPLPPPPSIPHPMRLPPPPLMRPLPYMPGGLPRPPINPAFSLPIPPKF